VHPCILCPRLEAEWIGRISWLPRAPLGPIFMTGLYTPSKASCLLSFWKTSHKNRSQRRPGQPWDPPNSLRSKPRTEYRLSAHTRPVVSSHILTLLNLEWFPLLFVGQLLNLSQWSHWPCLILLRSLILLKDLGDGDIALGPHSEVKNLWPVSFENHHQTSTETGHRFLPLSVVL